MKVYIRYKTADNNLETYWMVFEWCLDTKEENVARIQAVCPKFVWENRVVVSYQKLWKNFGGMKF